VGRRRAAAAVVALVGGAAVSLTAAGAEILDPATADGCGDCVRSGVRAGPLAGSAASADGVGTVRLCDVRAVVRGRPRLLPRTRAPVAARSGPTPRRLCVGENVPVVCYPRAGTRSASTCALPTCVFAHGERKRPLAALQPQPARFSSPTPTSPLRLLRACPARGVRAGSARGPSRSDWCGIDRSCPTCCSHTDRERDAGCAPLPLRSLSDGSGAAGRFTPEHVRPFRVRDCESHAGRPFCLDPVRGSLSVLAEVELVSAASWRVDRERTSCDSTSRGRSGSVVRCVEVVRAAGLSSSSAAVR
jgi:hypothetical protein